MIIEPKKYLLYIWSIQQYKNKDFLGLCFHCADFNYILQAHCMVIDPNPSHVYLRVRQSQGNNRGVNLLIDHKTVRRRV